MVMDLFSSRQIAVKNHFHFLNHQATTLQVENRLMNEIIYILINEAMPGYVKVGRTTNLEQRMKGLYRTAVPLPFECFYACSVKDGSEVEKWLFDIFDDRRVSKNREFFEIAPERITVALKAKKIEEVTPGQDYVETEEDQAALNKVRLRRSTFNFKLANIPVGATLTFSRDQEIVCKVIDNRNIEYNGEQTSLNKATLAVFSGLGYNWTNVQGTLYWEYEGETLDERRRRLEEE